MWIEAISTKVKTENFYNHLVTLTQFQPGNIHIPTRVHMPAYSEQNIKEKVSSHLFSQKVNIILFFYFGSNKHT